MVNLWEKSVQVMKEGQERNGAFPASPAFVTYRYSWLRDGTFTAYALDLAGEHVAAANFYRWVHGAVGHYLFKVEDLVVRRREGKALEAGMFLHTRYTVEGDEGTEEWGNHQLDGYGAYLWGVAEHLRLSGDVVFLEEVRGSVEGVIRYLVEFWGERCFDCWEEFGDRVHTSTLAAVYGGLKGISRYVKVERVEEVLAEIKGFVERECVVEGRFCKSVGDERVDANLLWVTVPFGMFDGGDERVVATVAAIERELVTVGGGGVHRYRGDSFYGGGAWVLLTAWLGWYYAAVGKERRARELVEWVERQADEKGCLPEQVAEGLMVPDAYGEWVGRWGECARPLLWSHAMYVVVRRALRG